MNNVLHDVYKDLDKLMQEKIALTNKYTKLKKNKNEL